MKKVAILTLAAVIVLTAAISFTACTQLFSTLGGYSLDADATVDYVEEGTEIDEAFVKSILSVKLNWTDGTATNVAKVDYDVEFTETQNPHRLEIKVIFGRKKEYITLDIKPAPLNVGVSICVDEMITADMAGNDSALKKAISVAVSVGEDGFEIEDDKYTVVKNELSEDGTQLLVIVYVQEYQVFSDETELNINDNPKLKLEGCEDAFVPKMTEEQVRQAVAEHVKVYIVDKDGNKQYLQYEAQIEMDEDNVCIKFVTEENGYTEFGFINRLYPHVMVNFDSERWKANMTDAEIIERLDATDIDQNGEIIPFELNSTTRIERMEYGTVRVFMDDIDLGITYVGYDESENPFA